MDVTFKVTVDVPELIEKIDTLLRSVGHPSATIVLGPVMEQGASTPLVRQPPPLKGRITMKATQKSGPLVLTGLKDRLGNPATLNGDVAFESSDPAIAAIEDGPDGKYVVAKGGLGTCTITATGDASSDEGVQPFAATAGVQVTSGDVTEGTLTLGAVVEQ